MVRDIHINVLTDVGFEPSNIEVPDNIAYIARGLQRMFIDKLLSSAPHIKENNGVYTLYVSTYRLDKNIIQQIKDIAINKNCIVEEDNVYQWITIANEIESIDKYFEEE